MNHVNQNRNLLTCSHYILICIWKSGGFNSLCLSIPLQEETPNLRKMSCKSRLYTHVYNMKIMLMIPLFKKFRTIHENTERAEGEFHISMASVVQANIHCHRTLNKPIHGRQKKFYHYILIHIFIFSIYQLHFGLLI